MQDKISPCSKVQVFISHFYTLKIKKKTKSLKKEMYFVEYIVGIVVFK